MTHVGSQKILPVPLNKVVFFSTAKEKKKYSSPIKEYSFPTVFRAPDSQDQKELQKPTTLGSETYFTLGPLPLSLGFPLFSFASLVFCQYRQDLATTVRHPANSVIQAEFKKQETLTVTQLVTLVAMLAFPKMSSFGTLFGMLVDIPQ